MIIKKKLSERDKLEYLTHGGRTGVSRRNFIGAAAAGFVFAPSVFDLVSRKLYAQSQECEGLINNGPSPFGAVIEYHAAGGAAWIEDFTCGGEGGQLDFITGEEAYWNYGIPDDQNYNIPEITPDSSLGVLVHPDSAFINGFNSAALPGVKDHMAGFLMALKSSSDTSQNQMSAAHIFAALGRNGSLTYNIGTQTGKASGGHHELAIGTYVPYASPTKVSSPTEARAIAGLGDLVDRLVDKARAEEVLKTLGNMSLARVAQLNNLTPDEQLKVLVGCGYEQATATPGKTNKENLFPTLPGADLDLINQAFAGEISTPEAAIAHLVLKDFAGVGVMSFGGYDSHDGTATTSYQKRLGGAQRIATLFNYAFLLKKKLTVIMLTDGGMGKVVKDGVLQTQAVAPSNTPLGGQAFRAERPGDSDILSCAVCLTFDPNRTATQMLISTTHTQVGAFAKSGVKIDYLNTSNDPSKAALCMAYNWLALHGKEDEIKKVNSGVDPFAGRDNAKYLIFKGSKV